MKNEKFCFSKGTGLIAIVGILLVGFVIANQSLTDTKTSTNSRASFEREGSGPSTITPAPVAIAGAHSISELKEKAVGILKKYSVAGGFTATLNTSEIANQQTKITSAQSAAELAYSTTSTTISNAKAEILNLGVVISEQKNKSDKQVVARDLNKSAKEILYEDVKGQYELKKNALATAKADYEQKQQNTKDAQVAVNNTNMTPDQYAEMARRIAAQNGTNRVALAGTKNDFLNELSTITQPSWTPGLNATRIGQWKAAINRVTAGNALGYMQVLQGMKAEEYKYPVVDVKEHPFGIALKKYPKLSKAEFNFEVTALVLISQENYEKSLTDNADKFKNLKDAQSAEATAKLKYEAAMRGEAAANSLVLTAEAWLRAAKETLTTVKAEDSVNGDLLAHYQMVYIAVTELTLSETEVLPAGVAPMLKVTTRTTAADLSSEDGVQTQLNNINIALTNANTAFEAFNAAIPTSGSTSSTGSTPADEVAVQVTQYRDYCAGIKPAGKYSYIVEPSYFGGVLPAVFAQDYYDTHCKANEGKLVWNGIYGAGAKCYTATGLCSNQTGADGKTSCNNAACILRLDGSENKGCIYREDRIAGCASGPYSDILVDKSAKCSASSYFKIGGDYYNEGGVWSGSAKQQNAFSDIQAGVVSCAQRKVVDVTEIGEAKLYISKVGRDVCRNDKLKFGWNNNDLGRDALNNKKQVSIALTDIFGSATGEVFTPSRICYSEGTLLNTKNSSCINERVSDRVCQCQDTGGKVSLKDGGGYTCSRGGREVAAYSD